MATPDYVLIDDFEFTHPASKQHIILKAGTFVKPIHIYYVPKHVKEAFWWYNPEMEFYCYCSAGFILAPKKSIRRV